MAQIYETDEEIERVLLIGVALDDNDEAESSLDELAELAAVSEIPEITDSAFDFLTPEELALITEYYDGDKTAAARKNNISMNGLYIRIHRIKKKLLDSAVRMNKINK